jgi:hypothetical protein
LSVNATGRVILTPRHCGVQKDASFLSISDALHPGLAGRLYCNVFSGHNTRCRFIGPDKTVA